MSSLLALIFVTCGSGQMAALSKHCPAQRLWAALIGWGLSEEESRDFDAQPGPELGSRSVFGSTVQELGMWQPLHLPSPTPFHPWAVCPPPPPSTHSPCSLWMHGFHVVPPSAPHPGLVKPTAWVHVCVFVLVLQSCGWIPIPPKRCITLKQGEKLTLSIHLQECGADLRVGQQLTFPVWSWSRSRLQVVES